MKPAVHASYLPAILRCRLDSFGDADAGSTEVSWEPDPPVTRTSSPFAGFGVPSLASTRSEAQGSTPSLASGTVGKRYPGLATLTQKACRFSTELD